MVKSFRILALPPPGARDHIRQNRFSEINTLSRFETSRQKNPHHWAFD
jgi:hypothetical protein